MNEKELRQLINEVAAEIIAESPINPGDDSVPFDHQGEGYENDRLDREEAELEDYPQATHFSDDPGNDAFMAWSTAAAGLMKDSKITQAEDIPWFTDAYGNAELSPYDEYKLGTTPKEYAHLVDEYKPAHVRSEEKDFNTVFKNESKEFTFDKFVKDINSREDKIEQHKIELTENDGDTNARLKQRLYQEDWRNSVKLKRNK
jgi:hypothetical protein